MFHFAPKISTNGLICHFDAANPNWGTNQKWNDLTSNDYDGTPISASFSNTNLGSINFDGTSNAKVTLPPLPLLGVDKFTIQVWTKFSGSKSVAFFSLGSSGSFPNDILFAYEISGNVIFAQIDNGGDGTGRFVYTPGNWINLSLVYNGNLVGNSNRLKIYLNGVDQSLTFDYTVPSTTTASASNYEVGNYVCSSGWNHNGQISTFSIYNRDLSSTEVMNNFIALRKRFNL